MTVWYIFDDYGNGYYKARMFETRAQAVQAAQNTPCHERPHRSWIGNDIDPGFDEEKYSQAGNNDRR